MTQTSPATLPTKAAAPDQAFLSALTAAAGHGLNVKSVHQTSFNGPLRLTLQTAEPFRDQDWLVFVENMISDEQRHGDPRQLRIEGTEHLGGHQRVRSRFGSKTAPAGMMWDPWDARVAAKVLYLGWDEPTGTFTAVDAWPRRFSSDSSIAVRTIDLQHAAKTGTGFEYNDTTNPRFVVPAAKILAAFTWTSALWATQWQPPRELPSPVSGQVALGATVLDVPATDLTKSLRPGHLVVTDAVTFGTTENPGRVTWNVDRVSVAGDDIHTLRLHVTRRD